MTKEDKRKARAEDSILQFIQYINSIDILLVDFSSREVLPLDDISDIVNDFIVEAYNISD